MRLKSRDKVKVNDNVVFHESAGGYLFCEEKNKLYVALLKDKDGKYFIPKGHLNAEETPGQAASNEIMEELGLKESLRKIAKVGIVTYSFNKLDDNREHFKTLHIYAFQLSKRLDIRPLGEEGYIAAEWFEVEDALEILEFEKDTLHEAVRLYIGYRALRGYLKTIVDNLRNSLGNNLIAIIDSGSISHGGFKPGWSDIDLLIVVKSLDLHLKLQIAREVSKLRKVLNSDIGIGVIPESEFSSPKHPEIRMAGKTLQALIEYSSQPERLLYSKEKVRAYIPPRKVIRAFSLSNIALLVLSNRKELTGNTIAGENHIKKIVEKQIKYCFIMMKLALQYYRGDIYETKLDTLLAAKLYFRDFIFSPMQEILDKTGKWEMIDSQSELEKMLEIADEFIENFSKYIFTKKIN